MSIIPNMPAAEYHAMPGVSASLLKRLYTSHAKEVYEWPVQSTPTMDLGTAFHAFMLEPKFFEKYYIEPPHEMNWATKEGKSEKAAWQAVKEANVGKLSVSRENMKHIEAAATEFKNHPMGIPVCVALAEKTAQTELVLTWDEEEIGPCRARLDLLVRDPLDDIIYDFKSTKNAHPRAFQWDVLPTKNGLNYWIQAGWYYRGAKANGLNVEAFDFIASELTPAYGLTFHRIEEADLHEMQPKLTLLAQHWAECQKKNVYPNYPAIRHVIALGERE